MLPWRPQNHRKIFGRNCARPLPGSFPSQTSSKCFHGTSKMQFIVSKLTPRRFGRAPELHLDSIWILADTNLTQFLGTGILRNEKNSFPLRTIGRPLQKLHSHSRTKRHPACITSQKVSRECFLTSSRLVLARLSMNDVHELHEPHEMPELNEENAP